MLSRFWTLCLITASLLASVAPLEAQSAGQFDLVGPTIEVKVNRGGRTLPIAEVPSLAEGDRIWLHPVLADNQSIHYLMVVVFLRGSTNPPPDEWFTKAETWNKKVIEEGVYVNVPAGAQQAVVFLAPETGGDFSTIKNAVRGRPGSFVRASQDLNLATLDRARIDTYLDSLKHTDDPVKVKEESTMLARSLTLKLDQQCFDRSTDQQAPCLMQNQDAMIMDNGRSGSMTSGLVNGPASDLALQAGAAPTANYGYYNSYIAAAMDIARILDNLHTAQYQYIPALPSEDAVAMKLKLNTPPSFHNPKSVIVIALPPIATGPFLAPPLHPVDPKQVFCMQREPLVLPVEGSPAVFATQYAHGLVLHLEGKGAKGAAGQSVDLPAKPDPARGGFVVPTQALLSAGLGSEVEATVQGFWGFDAYKGPTFKLESTDGADWQIADADRNALVVGREDELHLSSNAAACVDDVSFRDSQGDTKKADWKLTKPNEITAKLPLKDAQPGDVKLTIEQAGLKDPKTLSVSSFTEAGKLENFSMHAGDTAGILKGTRLDEVASLQLKGTRFEPGKLTRADTIDELTMNIVTPKGASAEGKKSTNAEPPVPMLMAGDEATANITLKDGRQLNVPATVDAARPQLTLLNKSVQSSALPALNQSARIQLANPDELPIDSKLTFALRSQVPATFSKSESLEIATDDGLFSVTFAVGSADLVLQDAHTAIATLDPMKSFGGSAFGPLQFRPILPDGTKGDWQKLATLVRLPTLSTLTCPPDVTQTCMLAGSNLFLVNSVAADAQFTKNVVVPDGFSGGTLEVPHVVGNQLYLKLRDNPDTVNTVLLESASKPTQRAKREHHDVPPPATTAPGSAPDAGDAAAPAAAAPGASAAPASSPAPTPAPAASTASPSNSASTPVTSANPPH